MIWRLLNIDKEKLPSILRNKYFVASVIFILWIAFFDQNNLVERYKNKRYYSKLSSDMEYYKSRIEKDNRRLNELKTDKENLEKFAREEYFMKKPNEDIFIIVEED